MYKSYRAWTGQYPRNSQENIDDVIGTINANKEEIVSVTSVGMDNVWVLIVTRSKKPYHPVVVRDE